MGCDSHVIVEVRRKNGLWGIAENKNECFKDKDDGLTWEQRYEQWPEIIKLLGSRDYCLFSIIADVRNDGSITPLWPNRGLPDDVSAKTAKEFPLDSDYHSHTFFTLAELKAVGWEDIALVGGHVILFADQYQEWKETGKVPDDVDEFPYDHSEITREVTEHEMTMLLMAEPIKKLTKKGRFNGGGAEFRKGPYVTLTVDRTYRNLGDNLYRCIAELEKIAKAEKVKDDENIRVIICFDN